METNGSVRLLGRSPRDCIIAFAVSLLHVHYGKQWGTQLPKSPLSQLRAFTARGGQDRTPLPPGWFQGQLRLLWLFLLGQDQQVTRTGEPQCFASSSSHQ